jgi:serine/threonine-protein kinase HipA
VLYEDAEATVSLAPAYDIICTTLYNARDVLALTLRGLKEFPDRARLETFGRLACSLTQRQVNEVLARVQAGARKACAEIGKYSTKNVDFTGAGDLLIAAFEHGVDRSIG